MTNFISAKYDSQGNLIYNQDSSYQLARIATDSTGQATGLFDPVTGATIRIARSMTLVQLLAAVALGYVGNAFVTDIGNGSIWVSDGVRARPLGNSMDLYNSPSVSTSTTSTTRNVVSPFALLPGVWKDGDVLEICADVSKSGTVDSAIFQIQIGSVAGTVGTQISNANIALNTTAVRGFATWRVRRNSATSVTLLNSAAGGDGATSTVNVAGNTTAVANMDSATTYLQFTNAMTTAAETLSIEHARVTLKTGT